MRNAGQAEDQTDQLAARIAEIDNALLTRAPTALDGALLLVERKSAYEALHPDSTHGGDRKSPRFQEIKTKTFSFCSDAAQRLGLSERAIQLKVNLGEAVVDYAGELRNTPIVDNENALRQFVALDVPHRKTVLGLWRDNAKLSFGAALIAARLRAEADSDETSFQRLLDGWTRASSKARRRFLTEIGIDAKAAEAAVVRARKGSGK